MPLRRPRKAAGGHALSAESLILSGTRTATDTSITRRARFLGVSVEFLKEDIMAIAPKCDKCQKELKKPGALVFSPPESVEAHAPVDKYHVCSDCWRKWLKPAFRVVRFGANA